MQQSKQQLQPPTPRVAEGPLEKQGMSASLTNQLHQAAVSVMKWKMQLENEIKQRDGKISELQETIKNIKSSLLNEQQISESLSGKLQNEMFTRADVTSRITKTRDICISLEKHCSYLSTAMKKCCEEMATVKAAQFEYVSELEKLIEKSENCDQIICDLTKERDELMEIYLEEKEEREKITEDTITLKSLIDQKMEEAKVAVAREAEKAVKVEANLTLIEEKYQTLTSLNEHLRQQLTLNEQMHLEKECTLDADISLFKNLFEDNKCALLEERAKLADFEIKAVTLQAEMAKLEEEQSAAVEKDKTNEVKIRELALKLDEISQALAKETGDLSKLKAEKDSLELKLLVIAELETELAKEKLEVARFSNENRSLVQVLSAVEEDLKCSTSAFDLSQKELKDLSVKLDKAVEETQSVKNSNQELLKNLEKSGEKLIFEIETCQKLKELLEQEKTKAADLRQKLKSLSSESATETGQLNSKLGDLGNTLAIVKTQLQQKIEIISNLSIENISLKENIVELSAALKNEQECSTRKITVLEGKLSDKEDELKIFNSSHSTLQESLQSLQEELDGANTQLNDSNNDKKALDAEIKELENTLKTAKSEKNTAEAKLKRLETKIANLEKEKKNMKEKMAKARSDSLQNGEQKDQAISDFEETIKEKDEQIAELEQSLIDTKAAIEDEVKGKDSKICEMIEENNKVMEKLEMTSKEKLKLEAKVAKLAAQLTDTIENSNEISTKHEAEKKKLISKIKSSQDQLSSKYEEASKLQVLLNSQISSLSVMKTKSDGLLSTSPLTNSVSEKRNEEVKRSIIKGANGHKELNTSRKIIFSDNFSYISLDEDETSSISSQAPTTPTKAKTQNYVPTTPRKLTSVANLSTPRKVIDADDSSDTSSFIDIVQMNEQEVEERIEQIRSPARALSAKIALATPSKRQNTPNVDGPQKKKGRNGGILSRQAAKYKQL